MLGHETEVEQGKILGVGVLDGNELSQHVLSVSAESGVGRDGHEALEELAKDASDLVISDIRMPGMDGMTMVKELRKDSLGANVPIIILPLNREPM